MKIKLAVVALVAVGIVALTGCSSMHKSNKANGGAPVSDMNGAQAQGYGSETNFGGGGSNLKAPAHQTYHFAYDKDVVNQDDYGSIQAQAKYLVAHPNASVRLEGNTDDRGSREYNVGLGWRRAKAVASLLEQYGVSSKQITMVSYGAEKPVATGENEAAFEQNRRVELIYKSY